MALASRRCSCSRPGRSFTLGTGRCRSLWIGDEAWELDYYLHENPELKSAAYAWLTDFVGWLPMPDGGDREAALTADYNAEMIDHAARFPRVRDRAIFVGDPADIVPDAFGPDLPPIREWTQRNYDFAGYLTGFNPSELADRAALGYRDGERVCIVTVGGSGVGGHLLRRVIAAFPEAKRLVPDLRMIVVADGDQAAVPVLPAAAPLRAELPCPAPARTPRRRPAHGLPDRGAGRYRRRDRD